MFETRYEWLRPEQLKQRQQQCSLVILPVAPLEYHGPHLPIGVDALNASAVAHQCCKTMNKGVVMPTLYAGTERERDAQCLEALGFSIDDYVVGMDFPSRLWNSHYLPEEMFALLISAELRLLIDQGYKYIFIANGHGAVNQKNVLKRLCIEFTNTTDASVDFCLTLDEKAIESNTAGHADLVETSLMMYYNEQSVDIATLPPEQEGLKYKDFSIVDGPGFTEEHSPDYIVRKTDPRNGSKELGQKLFEAAVSQIISRIEKMLKVN